VQVGPRARVPPVVAPAPAPAPAPARDGAMGLRRYERVQRSTRPHAKLGRGGGWNVGDDDARPSDAPAFPTPPKPGWGRAGAAAGEAENDGDVARDPAALASPPPAAVKPFSGGGGWRGAAPGFGDPEDRAAAAAAAAADPSTLEPSLKVLVGNLPTDVPPDAMRECLERHCEETLAAELRDVPGALVRPVRVAIFGPARPKLRRDRKRLHRGFALLEWTTAEKAAKAAEALDQRELVTPSAKTEGGRRVVKATADVGAAMDDAFLAGTQGTTWPTSSGTSGSGSGTSGSGSVGSCERPAGGSRPADGSLGPPFSMSELSSFPMRKSCLATHATLADLPPGLRRRTERYLLDAIPGMPELAAVVRAVELAAPRYTRVKELFETVEAFKLVHAFLAAMERRTTEDSAGDEKKIGTVFDLACGHGLLGVALAYAFPNKRVVACDRVRREALDVYLRAFGAFADAEASGRAFPEVPGLDDRDAFARNPPRPPDPDENPETTNAAANTPSAAVRFDRVARSTASSRAETASGPAGSSASLAALDAALGLNPPSPSSSSEGAGPISHLANFEFALGEVSSLARRVRADALVLATHGCNEANRDAMDAADEAGAAWCVMPCCVLKDLYLPGCVVSRLSDEARYAFLCGAMAARYDARMVRSVDRRITNRPFMLFGGGEGGEKTEKNGQGRGAGTNREARRRADEGPFQLRFPMDHKTPTGRERARRGRKTDDA
jgi:hypothetical protein